MTIEANGSRCRVAYDGRSEPVRLCREIRGANSGMGSLSPSILSAEVNWFTLAVGFSPGSEPVHFRRRIWAGKCRPGQLNE